MAAVLRLVGRRVQRVHPWAHGARLFGARIPARHFIAVTGRPNDIRIGGIGQRKFRFAAAHAMIPAGIGTAFTHIHAGPAHGGVVLYVAVQVIQNLIVNRDVIHLADRQRDVMKAPPTDRGNGEAAVKPDREALRIFRIHPDIVVIPAPRPSSNVRPPSTETRKMLLETGTKFSSAGETATRM